VSNPIPARLVRDVDVNPKWTVVNGHVLSDCSCAVCKSFVGFVTGGPGCGKSTQLIKCAKRLSDVGENYLVVVGTCVVRQMLISEGVNPDKVVTFAHLIKRAEKQYVDVAKLLIDQEHVLVDEISTVTPSQYGIFFRARKTGVKFLTFGDYDQQRPIILDKKKTNQYDGTCNSAVMWLVGWKRLEMMMNFNFF